jgi:hypothetical protein
MNKKRSAVNVVLPGRIFQRGQIFTWTRTVKAQCFEDLGLRSVVNFWPKIDSDLADMGLDWYWQLSTPRSEGMLSPHIHQAAASVADYLTLPDTNVLVLCEAGKTRSVFFCILVMANLFREQSYAQILKRVEVAIPGISLKGFMLEWIKEQE